MKRSSSRPLATDILIGAAVGIGATWVMGKVTTAMYEHESDEARRREDSARGGKTAYEIAASKTAEVAGVALREDEEKKLGSAIHWALGAGAGAAYAAARNKLPGVRLGSGIGYGLLFWLAMDEAALTLLHLTPPPKAFPWQAHMRGAVGHVVFGAVTEAVFDVGDAAR